MSGAKFSGCSVANVGVAPAANLGWASSDCQYYVKLDNDVEVLREDWLSVLLQELAANPKAGTVGYYIDRHARKARAALRFLYDSALVPVF